MRGQWGNHVPLTLSYHRAKGSVLMRGRAGIMYRSLSTSFLFRRSFMISAGERAPFSFERLCRLKPALLDGLQRRDLGPNFWDLSRREVAAPLSRRFFH